MSIENKLSSQKEKDCLVTIILPLSNDAPILETFTKKVHSIVSSQFENYELLLIDDGSQDSTRVIAQQLLVELDCIRYLRLSRSYGIETAITAGFETAIGDYTVVLIPSTDPAEKIPEIIQAIRSSSGGLVVGRSNYPLYSPLYRALQNIFCTICSRFFEIELPKNTTHLLGVNRHTLNSVNKIRDRFRYIKSFSNFLGATPSFFEYAPAPHQKKRSLYDALNLAIDIVVSNSVRPLRYISLLGLFLSTCNLLYFGYIGIVNFMKDKVAEGWTTLSTQNALSFFVLNLVLAVLAEYLGRLLVESKDRPAYFISEEKNSSVLISGKERRLNVVNSSIGS